MVSLRGIKREGCKRRESYILKGRGELGGDSIVTVKRIKY